MDFIKSLSARLECNNVSQMYFTSDSGVLKERKMLEDKNPELINIIYKACSLKQSVCMRLPVMYHSLFKEPQVRNQAGGGVSVWNMP